MEFQHYILMRTARLVGIARERIDWKGIPVKVVFQIKNARETGAGEIRLVPGAFLTLLVDEIGNGLANRRMAGVGPCTQSDQSPAGLRRRTGALPFRRRPCV